MQLKRPIRRGVTLLHRLKSFPLTEQNKMMGKVFLNENIKEWRKEYFSSFFTFDLN